MSHPAAIGSVFPLPEPDGPPRPDSLWSAWTSGCANASAYASARSAIAALLDDRAVQRLWLPAYLCDAVAQAAVGCEVHWYGVNEHLSPDVAALAAGLVPGDAVLGVDYFGRLPPMDFITLARCRPEVLWIEDRAQALDPGPAWGDAVVYSPRKLLGVGDGGLLLSDAELPEPGQAVEPSPSADGQRARAGDPDGEDPDAWYPAFQAQEASFAVDRRPMTNQTQAILVRTAAAPLSQARRANWSTLAALLPHHALWPETIPDFAPLAFPVRVKDAAAVVARMAEARIYCARHWAALPSPADAFPAAQALSRTLVSLPCDQRYGAADMARVAERLLEIAPL